MSVFPPVVFCRPSAGEKIGEALKAVLQQASSEGRVTCSLMSCVEVLSTRPDDVMLCVMPLPSHPDAAATIQSTLIRAVCQEHSIRVLSVDCDVKLAKMVCLSEEKVPQQKAGNDNCSSKAMKTPSSCNEDTMLITACDNMAPVMGFPCVLVQVCTNFDLFFFFSYLLLCS